MKDKRSYEKPTVVFEKNLEATAADCGTGINNLYMGGNNCKESGACAVTFS